jgi:hypothetical protein
MNSRDKDMHTAYSLQPLEFSPAPNLARRHTRVAQRVLETARAVGDTHHAENATRERVTRSVVLPWSTWPIMQTFARVIGVYV